MERDEKKALIAAGINVTDRVFTAEEVSGVTNEVVCCIIVYLVFVVC